MKLSPRESGEFIVENAKHVKVNEDGIKNLANIIFGALMDKSLSIENFSHNNFHPKPTDPHALDWIFVIDTLNFCFWSPDKENSSKWKVENNSGYFALCAAINRALKEGINITDPAFYSKITIDEVSNILRPDDGKSSTIPLLSERQKCLHEVGSKLIEKYSGSFKNVVLAANGSAKKLLDLIVTDFPCFRDEAEYCGQRVSIYKRAQILVGDVFTCFRGDGIGAFEDIEVITMFADYRVPQVLIHFNALSYSDDLMKELQEDRFLVNGEEKEVEIRGASIFIVEKVKEKVVDILNAKKCEISPKFINSILIDHFLWDYRRAHADMLASIPFHKTLCIYY